MNRRGFIATITALAGVVLAKIKAPAAPKDYPAAYGTRTFKPWPPGTTLTYTQTPDGKYRWVPIDKT